MALNTEPIVIEETPLDLKDGGRGEKEQSTVLNFEPTARSLLGKLASLETRGGVCKVGTSIRLVTIIKLIFI